MTTALLFVVAALIVGYSKTALGGLAAVAVAIFASVLPAKESTAAVLVLLIVGDLVAIWHYRRDADWGLIRRLLPMVVPGIVLGSVFLGLVSDTVLRRSIGVLLLVLVLLQLWVTWRTAGGPAAEVTSASRRWKAGLAGMAAGFATMTANSAGAVMAVYLSQSGFDKRRFVGTNAWFFLIVNVSKLPFSIGLGLLHWRDLGRAALLAPVILAGGLLGYATVERLRQHHFDRLVLLASAVAALALIVR